MRVIEADKAQAAAVLRRSFEIWGEGATFEDYVAGNLAQLATPWARTNYRFLAAEDDGGALLASLKWFTFPAVIDGAAAQVTGLGAVFTPEEQRRRGHAAALVEATLERARARGDAAALLMSEIGGAYYERLSFRSAPAMAEGCLPFLPVRWPKEPAWVSEPAPHARVEGLRPMRPDDLDALVAMHDRPAPEERFRLRRESAGWEQTLVKIEAGHRMWPEKRHRIHVIEARGEPVAYAVVRDAPQGVQWREHGALPGHEERLADLFWIALAEARARGVNRLDAWRFPDLVASRRLYPVARRPQRDPVVMLRGLQPDCPLPEFVSPDDVRISWLDLF
jgi:predicted N-acetyltransferase YhbS